MSSQRAVPSIPRIPAIDGLRGIAVLCVILMHCFMSTRTSGLRMLDPIVENVLKLSMPLAVDLFFVISGFLITSILDRTRDADRPLRTFYARRALRIVPLYYAFLLFVALFLSDLPARIVGPPGSMTWEFLFLTNIPAALDPKSVGALYPHFWTLAVEEQFYILWPLVILILPQRFNIRICLALIGLSVVTRLALSLTVSFEAALILTPARSDALAAGSIVGLLYHRNPDFLRTWWKQLMRFAGFGFLAAQAVFILTYAWNVKASFVFSVTVMPFIATVFFAAAVAGLALRQESDGGPRWLLNPVLTSTARYSYGMYAIHVPLITLLYHYGLIVQRDPVAGFDLPYRIYFFILIAGLSYGVGLVTWHLYEKQFLKLTPSYRYSGETEPTQAALPAGAIPVP